MADSTPSDYHLTYLRERWERDRSSRVFLQLAEEYRRRGQLADALEVLQAGLAHHPGYLAAQVSLGRCWIEAGKPAAAAEVLTGVLAQDPTQAVASRLLIDVWLRLGEVDRTRSAIERCELLGVPPLELQGYRERLAALTAQQGAGTPVAAARDEVGEPESGPADADAALPAEVGWGDRPALVDEEPSAFPAAPPVVPQADAPPGLAEPRAAGRTGLLAPAARRRSPGAPLAARPSPAAAGRRRRPVPAAGSGAGGAGGRSRLRARSGGGGGAGRPAPGEARRPGRSAGVGGGHSRARSRRARAGGRGAPRSTGGGPLVARAGRRSGTVDSPSAPPLAPSAPPRPAPAPVPAAPEVAAPPPAEAAPPSPAVAASAAPAVAAGGVEVQPSGALPAPELRPSDPGTATLGELYLRQGHLGEAGRIFHQVLERDPDNEVALRGLESIDRRRGAALGASEPATGAEPEVKGLTSRKILLLQKYLHQLEGRRGPPTGDGEPCSWSG